MQGRFGLQMAVKLVRGEPDPRLERAGLMRVQTFGNRKEHAEAWITGVLRRCVTAGWVSFSGGDRPVVVLTEEGRAVMRGERPVRLLLPPSGDRRRGPGSRAVAAERSRSYGAERSPTDDATPDAAAESLFQALRAERLRAAQREGVAPFIVASDRTLRDIALLRPRTLDELREAHGIGPHKAERYGSVWLEVVARAAAGDAAPGGSARPPSDRP